MKRFLLVCGIGLDLVSGGSAYGDYPSPESILARLVGGEKDMSARFKRLFNEVRNEAAKCRVAGCVDPRKLVGEEKGLIALSKSGVSDVSLLDIASLNRTPSDVALSEESFSLEKSDREKGEKNGNPSYLADDERCWLRRYFVDGDFLVKIDGMTVQKSEDIDELTQCKKYRSEFAITLKKGRWKNEWHSKLADIFKTLASEVFMQKLLGEDTVRMFCDKAKASKTVVRVFCYPCTDPLRPSESLFHLMYHREAGVPLWIGFDIRYDIKNNRLTDDPVTVSPFKIGKYRIVANKTIGRKLTNKHLLQALGSPMRTGDNIFVFDE